MKKFIRTTASFISIFIIIYISAIAVNFFKVKSNQIIIPKNKNILILGDSNSQMAINDSIFVSSMNFSQSADPYFYSYLKLKKIIKSNQHIDTVLLSFSPHNIFSNNWTFNKTHIHSRIGIYYPLMEWEDLKYLIEGNPSAILSSTPSIIKKVFRNIVDMYMGRRLIETYYSPYVKSDRNLLQVVQDKLKNDEKLPFFSFPDNVIVSEEEVLYLNKIIFTCKNNGLTLFLVNVPKRKELLIHQKYGVEEFNNYYDRNLTNVLYLDFSNIIIPDDYYDDLVHLSGKGSDFFSMLLENEGIFSLSKKNSRKMINESK